MRYSVAHHSLPGTREVNQDRVAVSERDDLVLMIVADGLGGYDGGELAAEMGATSADHLVYISDKGIDAMARKGVAAVLLPGTCFSLKSKDYAPARKMIDSGAIVALSTDCNPGSSFTESLQIIVTLAALNYGMTAAESITAITVNAACAIDRGGKIGQLLPGLPADIVLWNMQDFREMPYHYGINLVDKVIKQGKIVYE